MTNNDTKLSCGIRNLPPHQQQDRECYDEEDEDDEDADDDGNMAGLRRCLNGAN